MAEVIIKIKADAKGAKGTIGDLANDTRRGFRDMEKSGTRLQRSWASLKKNWLATVAVIGGALISLKKVINIAGELEEGWIAVAKTTGLAGDELERLKTEIREMSVEMKGLKIEELQNIARQAGQLGINGAQNIAEFTRVVGMMSVATVLSAEESAESFAELANVLDEPIEKIETMGSVINELSNNSTANSRHLVDLALRMGAVAHNAGFTTAEIFALSAALKDAGITAEVGGTAISRLIQEMTLNLEGFAQVAGVSLDVFKEAVSKAPFEALKLFLKGLSQLNKFDATETLDSMGLAAGRLSRVILPLSNNLENLTAHQERANNETKKGTSLAKEYNTAAKGMFSQATSVGNAFKILAEDMGKTFLPVIKTLLPWVKKSVDLFTDFGKEVGRLAAGFAGYDISSDAFFNLSPQDAQKLEAYAKGIERVAKEIDRLESEGAPQFVIDDQLRIMDLFLAKYKELVPVARAVALAEKETAKRANEARKEQIKGLTEVRNAQQNNLNIMRAQYQTYTDEIIALDNQIKKERLTAEALINKLRESLLSPEQLRNKKRLDAAKALSKGVRALAKGDFDNAKKFALKARTLFADLGTQVEEGGKIIVDKTTAVNEAVNGVTDSERLLDQVLESQIKKKKESQDALTDPMKAAQKEIKDLTKLLKELQDQTTTHTVDIDAADALATVDILTQDTSSTHTINVVEVQGRQFGGPVRARTGRHLPGYGGGDRIPLLAEAGEYVVRKEAVRHYGRAVFDSLNRMSAGNILSRMAVPGFAAGGAVSPGTGGDGVTREMGTLNLTLDGKTDSIRIPGDVFKSMADRVGTIKASRGGYRPPWEG